MKKALPAAVVLALAACKQAAPPKSFQAVFEGLSRSPACSQNVPMEWVSTWPVPQPEAGTFRVLFYSLDRSTMDADGLPRVRPTAPRGRASFSADGKVAECSASGEDAVILEGERYPVSAMELEEEAFDDATRELLALTHAAGTAYARGEPAPKTAAQYWKAFQKMAEPALLPHYYRLNPAFWEWLRREAGASLPAAK